MNSLEAVAAAWMLHAERMTWVSTLALLVVLVLRRPLRRAFGAEVVPLLWLLVPFALLAAQLPHPVVHAPALPPVVVRIAGGGSWVPPAAMPEWTIPGSMLAMGVWLAGAIAVLVSMGVAQRRYLSRLSGARAIEIASARRPVWLASDSDLGPAAVGAWAVRIVLPDDFLTRYTSTEQVLILAHEQVHASRRDGLWRLLAQLLTALFWFNPLAWYAQACLRQDQELACDAVVLREHGAPRREYARAMLKTQASPLTLPVGCSWSSRHPLTERVAMLKWPVPARSRRLAARTVLGAFVAAGAFAVYAAGSAPSIHHPSADAVKEAMVLFDGTKEAVEVYWSDHHFDLPPDNLAAQLPDASLIIGKYVEGVELVHGRLTATLRNSAGGGHVVLLPLPDVGHKTMGWRCESPDIPDIAHLSRGCVYVPGMATNDASVSGRFTLQLEISVAGQSPHLHSTTCLEGPTDAYRFVNSADKTLPPWTGQLSTVAGPDGQVEVHARLSGGSLSSPEEPVVRLRAAQKAAIQVGKVVGGVDHTLRLDISAWPGCGAAPPVADDDAVYERFSGPSARVMVGTIAARAGLRLLDPGTLDNTRSVAGNFEGVPARQAQRLIGNLVGMTPVFSGHTVRFVAK